MPVRRILSIFVPGPVLVVSCLLGTIPAGTQLLASVPAATPAAQASHVDVPTETSTLQEDLNQLRRAQDLPELAFPASLQQIALARALEVASSSVLDHGSLPGGEAAVLAPLESAGFSGRVAEHLARVTDPGPSLAATVMRAWFSDSAHRADLLDVGYGSAGIGIAYGQGGWVVVQILAEAAPQEAAP